MWVMSDRGIPRSFRMMEGFGVHTFRMINAKGVSKFVKFHWRPTLGTFSLIWDEAVKIGGADPDFHRRDLFNAIENGDYPEWELSVQIFTEEQAEQFSFDVLDPTKLIPEELVPLTPLGRMVLDRNVDNFFAETEQVAYCVSHVVPGIDFSNDPLLQGRLFSYLDTQLSRLGSPNFHQIPVNKPKCPFANFQRDGHMQMGSQTGSVANEPNTLDDGLLREDPNRGFKSYAAEESGQKLRIRPESFADHYTQARLFYRSMTEPEQRHIADAFAFELGKCLQAKIRRRMLGHLEIVEGKLAARVADSLGMIGQADKTKPYVPVSDVDPSPMLSQYTKAPKTIAGKKIGVLVTPSSKVELIDLIKTQARSMNAIVELVALKIGSKIGMSGNELEPDHFLAGAPSSLFDFVLVAPGEAEVDGLLEQAAAIDWIRDAYGHLKIIGYVAAALPLFERAAVATDGQRGVLFIDKSQLDSFFECAKQHRIWDRELKIR